MPVTRADATPPLIPAVLSAKHYVTLTMEAQGGLVHVRLVPWQCGTRTRARRARVFEWPNG